jgi:hypothetical protein
LRISIENRSLSPPQQPKSREICPSRENVLHSGSGLGAQ